MVATLTLSEEVRMNTSTLFRTDGKEERITASTPLEDLQVTALTILRRDGDGHLHYLTTDDDGHFHSL